jgi:glutamine amidotransferase
MCIAIYKPQDKIIPKKTLIECYDANPDGAGFMYAEDKKLHIQKGFFSFNAFYKAYKEHQHKQAVLHFRIKTHGKIDTTNCHPFSVNNSIGFVHNGIITGFGDTDHSDTIGFNNGVLQPLVNKWGNLALFQDPIKELIESRIGYSKLIFLDRHGNHNIFNEHKGVWDDDVWYSNNSYKPYVAPKVTTPTKPSSTWYDEDYSYNWRKPVATYKPAKNVGLKVGDMVELLEDVADPTTLKTYESGEIAEIVAVNQDFSCDLMIDGLDGNSGFLYNVSYHVLNWVDDFEDDTIDPVGVPAYHNYASPYLLKGNK